MRRWIPFVYLPILAVTLVYCGLWVRSGVALRGLDPELGSDGWTLPLWMAMAAPPLVVAASWRLLRWPMRGIGLGLATVFVLSTARDAAYTVATGNERARWHADGHSMEQGMRIGREMMRIPPEEAAARAARIGDHRLLAIEGISTIAPGVGLVWMPPQRMRVFPETSDMVMDREHGRYQMEAGCYALRYNRELIRRLGRDAWKDRSGFADELAGRCAAFGAR